MAGDARQAALSRPSAVAIHDDRDVRRQCAAIDLMQKFGISQGVNDASNAASNSYNALQSKMTKRFSHGVSLLASYTWSKTLDFGGGVGPAIGNQVTRGPAAWDRKHVLSIGHTYELPFGKGHRYLLSMPRAGEYLLGGWQFSGITQYQSGWPFSPGLNNNASINADVGTPPDVVPGADPYNLPGGQNRDEKVAGLPMGDVQHFQSHQPRQPQRRD